MLPYLSPVSNEMEISCFCVFSVFYLTSHVASCSYIYKINCVALTLPSCNVIKDLQILSICQSVHWNMVLNYYLSAFSLLTLCLLFISSEGAYNVVSFGGRADGRSDSTAAFLRTWTVACKSAKPATIIVPKGRFMVRQIEFRGPCRSRISIFIYGTIAAPAGSSALGNAENWILFAHVNRMSIHGGTIDANGASYWACRKSGKSCPTGATVILWIHTFS